MNKKASLYNLENLHQIYDSDKEIIGQIVKVFIDTVPQYITELSEASRSNNWNAAAFTAHKLKSTLKLFKIDTALDDILIIERDAKALVNLEHLPYKIEKVISIIKTVADHLKANEKV